MDQNSLTYVTIAVLAIERLSPEKFQVEQHYAGKIDLGPMSETELYAYLKNRRLVGVTPAQVINRLEAEAAMQIYMVVSVVRAAMAAS